MEEFKLIANVDRITIDASCLRHGVTLDSLAEKLTKVTMNVRQDHGNHPRLEIYFNANDYSNMKEGYEKGVMQIISENTDRVIIFSNDISIEADFEPATM